MSELHLVVFSLILLGAILVVPAVIAIFKGVKWWRELKRSGPRPRIRVLEIVLFLIALVPGLSFVFVFWFGTDERVLIPLGILMSLGMGSGALLGWLHAHATVRAYSRTRTRTPSSPAGTMVAGALLAAVWSFVFLLALPGLLPTRIASNEAAVIACLRAYVSAQEEFRKADRYGTGRKVYANPRDGGGFRDLYHIGYDGTTVPEKPVPHLVGLSLADADVRAGRPKPKAGFLLADITGDADGPYDYTKQHGLCAIPYSSSRGGRNILIVDHNGRVYQRDVYFNLPQGAWPPDPITIWPDVEKEGWLLVGD